MHVEASKCPTVQVTKLDTDPASASAKPGSAAPSKVAAPPPSTHDPKTGPWVRFWQDKPQHWGPPPAVKSPLDLAAANIQRDTSLPPSKPPLGLTSGHPVAARSSHASETWGMHASEEAARTAAHTGGSGSAAEASAADVSPVLTSGRISSDKQDAANVNVGQSSAPVTAVPAGTTPGNHASFEEAAPTNTAVSGAPGFTSVPVSAAAGAGADAAAAPAKPPGKQAAFNMYSPSKGALQILRKPPSKELSPRKQVPLDQLLAKQTAKAQAEDPGTSSSEAPWQQQQQPQQQQQQQPPQQQQQQQQHPQQTSLADRSANPATTAPMVARVVLPHAVQPAAHSHQLAKLQGLTLSQIDASVFAALPAGHQQELLHNLPKATTRASGAAPVESKQLGASDFAFITKLANLQKGGQARSASALDPDGQSKATECGQRSSESTVAAAQGTDIPVDRLRGEGTDSGLTATSLGSAKQSDGGALPLAVIPLSDQAAARPEEDAVALPVSPSDPAFISQLSPDSAAVHAVSHASPSVVNKGNTILDAHPTASHDHSNTGRPAMSAQAQHTQQAQHAQQAQPPAQLAAAAAAGGKLEDADMDQALDMDLMEEEWAALAAQGQHAAPDNRHTFAEPPTAGSAPLHHSLAQQGSGAADSGAPAKQSYPLHASSGAGAGQMQGWGAAGMQQQQQQPVSALPPASQIDSSVLDALPLQVRRELELAYGIAT